MAGKRVAFKTVYRGESKTYVFRALDDADAPQDITGASVEFLVNYPVGPPYTPKISKTNGVGGGITIQDQTSALSKGKFTVVLSAADTGTPDPLDYRAEAWVTIGGYRRLVVAPSVWPLRDAVRDPA